MATHLLVWNPDRWSWGELSELLHGFMQGRPVTARWSCGTNRRLRARDRFFLMRLNRYPSGIFASGRIIRGAHEMADLTAQDSGRSGRDLFVEVRFDMLADPDRAMPLTRRELARGALGKYRWELGGSGRTLPDGVAAELEAVWAEHFGSAVAACETPPPAPRTPPAAAHPAAAAAPAAADSGHDPDADPGVDNELYAALFAHYFSMLEAGVRGEVLGQAEHFRKLMNEFGALSEARIRQEYAEVSAVLLQCGLPFLDVYPPAEPVKQVVRRQLVRYLSQARARLEDIWLGEAAVRRVRLPDEVLDLPGAWAAPPLNDDFRVDAFLAGRARFPRFGGFQRREERFDTLREAGCRFALAFERTRLKMESQARLARRVRLLEPAERTDGFDMVSFDPDGAERYIRVAATQYSRRFPLLVEPRTLVASYRHGERFYLYRVFHFCWDAKVFMVQGDLREALQFLPKGREPGTAEKRAQE